VAVRKSGGCGDRNIHCEHVGLETYSAVGGAESVEWGQVTVEPLE